MRSLNYALLSVLIQQNTVMFFSYSIRNYNAMTSEIWTKDNLWRKILGEILKGLFCYCQDLKMSWLEHFRRFNRRGVWSKNALWVENSEKINKWGDVYWRPESRSFFYDFFRINMGSIVHIIVISWIYATNMLLKVIENSKQSRSMKKNKTWHLICYLNHEIIEMKLNREQ